MTFVTPALGNVVFLATETAVRRPQPFFRDRDKSHRSLLPASILSQRSGLADGSEPRGET